MESKIPVWVGFFGFLFWFVFPIDCVSCRGNLGGPWRLDRTFVISSESSLHATQFSSFELCLIFCLKKNK